MGAIAPPAARPSTVVMFAPSAWTASIVQDLTGSPLSRTVHAPQLLVSQPMWVPVRRRLLRRKSTSRTRGSTSSLCSVPLTLRLTCKLPALLGAGDRGLEPALDEHPDHVLLVLDAAADVGFWLGGRRGLPRRLGDDLVSGLAAGQRLLRGGRLEVLVADRRHADAGLGDLAAVQLD